MSDRPKTNLDSEENDLNRSHHLRLPGSTMTLEQGETMETLYDLFPGSKLESIIEASTFYIKNHKFPTPDETEQGLDQGPLSVIDAIPALKHDNVEYEAYYYQECHRPDSDWNNQKRIQGILLDPVLPDKFDCYPISHRPTQELEDWSDLPYIRSSVTIVGDSVKTHFTVVVLDSGTWDRPTEKAWFDDIDSAISEIKKHS